MKLIWSSLFFTLFFFNAVFVLGIGVGRWSSASDVKVERIQRIEGPVTCFAAASELERTKVSLRRYQGLQRETEQILEEDRKIGELDCDRRIAAIVHTTYPPGARLVERSGVAARGDVEWFVGRGVPSGMCHAGSLYSRTDAPPALYVCEDGSWRTRP